MAFPEHMNAGEKTIARALVKSALKARLRVWVLGCGVCDLADCTDEDRITAEIAATDETTLVFRDSEGRSVGMVLMVHGNAPWEVIADHTDTPEMRGLLANATAAAARQEARA